MSMRDKLLDVIANVMEMDVDSLKDSLDDENVWDSLVKVEVIFEIEEEFDITFSEEDLGKVKTPEKLIEIVMDKA